MEVHTTSIMVPSSSNEPSSGNSRHLVRVCSQCNLGTLLWSGPKGDTCDRCMAYNASMINPMDATINGAYSKTASHAENGPKDLKEATSVAPVGSWPTANSAPSSKYPIPQAPYLLPSSQLESTHSFEAGTNPSHNPTSVSYQGRRPANSSNSIISVPVYDYYGFRKPNVSSLTREQNRTHLCRVCRAVMSSYTETLCPHCRFDAALSTEKTGFEERDRLSEPKEIVTKSNLEDDLTTNVMSMFSNPDENLDDDETDMEGIELSYPEVMNSEVVEDSEPQFPENSSSLQGSLPSVDLAPTPRNTSHSLKLCSNSTTGCTGIISSESSATRCLRCVRRDWRSKLLNGHASHNVDDGRLSSGVIKRSTSTKQNTKKVVTWADEVSHTPVSQKELEYNSTTTKPHQHSTPSVDLTSKCLNIGTLPSLPAEAQAPNTRLEHAIIPLNDPTTLPADLSVSSTQEEISASTSSTPVELASNDDVRFYMHIESDIPPEISPPLDMSPSAEVSIFGGSSDLSDLSDSGDDKETDISSSGSQGVGPHLPELATDSDFHLPPSSVPTGLKIRIPPRPGFYERKCGSIRCEQRLPTTYRWKSCVICRARNRGYRRTGPPFRDIFSDDPSLVAGARLCSVRSCTYIIPPSNEYLWKMCALCRLRAGSSRKFQNAPSSPRQDGIISQEFDSTAKIAACLPKRSKNLPGRCQNLDCGMLLSGTESSLNCDQCIARNSSLMNDGISKQTLEREGKSIPVHPFKPPDPSPYPRYKAFPNLLTDFKFRLNDFLQAQSAFILHNAANNRFNSAKAMFGFDAEYSIVTLDFDIVGHKEAVDGNVLKLKGEIERTSRIRFSPKRYISILEGNGIAERFFCITQVPVLHSISSGHLESAAIYTKSMQGELEIAVVPDHSHPFLPGQRTILRFRLLG